MCVTADSKIRKLCKIGWRSRPAPTVPHSPVSLMMEIKTDNVRTRTTLGMRSFAVAGPVIWNSLPAALLTTTLSPLTFARHLKAHLFG